ncbi:MAG: AI-2E family transporter [Anaerolineae bacterium]|nr:AI-2E family transporter [Anaerolineae bacterium]
MMQVTPPPEPQIEQWNWSPWVRQFVTVALVVACVYALTLLGPILSILIITFLLSFLIFVPSRLIAKYTRLNYTGSVLVVFLIILLLIFLLVLVIAPNVAQVSRTVGTGLSNELKTFEQSVRDWDPTTSAYNYSVLGLFQIDITPIASQIREALLATDPQAAAGIAQQAIINNIPSLDVGQIVSTATQVITSLIGTFTTFFSTLFLGLFLSLLILLELPAYQNSILSSGSAPFQRDIRLIGVKTMNVWQGFFRGQLLLAIIIGVITFLQLILMGVSGALAISIIVAVISLIPTIGGIIALVPLGLVPLLQGSSVFTQMAHGTFALLVVGVNLVISQFIWNVVAPKIMGDAVSLPLPVIIIGIIVGTALGGALGAFLIVPILGTARVIVIYLMAKVRQRDPFPGEEMPQFESLSKL